MIEFSITDFSANWIDECLSGTMYIAGAVRDGLKGKQVRVVVPWPSDLDQKLALDLDAGRNFGLRSEQQFSPKSWLVSQLSSKMEGANASIYLQSLYIEKYLNIPAGPLESYKSKDNFAYFVCEDKESVEDFVERYSLSGVGQHCIFVIVDEQSSQPLSAFMPVYDGESYCRIDW
jgi:hypothetical protein